MWMNRRQFFLILCSFCLCGAEAEILSVRLAKNQCEVGVDKVCRIVWTTNDCKSNYVWELRTRFVEYPRDDPLSEESLAPPQIREIVVGEVTESESYYDWYNTSQLSATASYALAMIRQDHFNDTVGLVSDEVFMAVLQLEPDLKDRQGSSCSTSSLGPGTYAGIAAGAAVLGAVLALCIWHFLKRWRRKKARLAIQQSTKYAHAPMHEATHDSGPPNFSKSELAARSAYSNARFAHPGSPLLYYPPPEMPRPSFHAAQELPAGPIPSSDGIWQGPGIAMVLPPSRPHDPSDHLDLDFSRAIDHKATQDPDNAATSTQEAKPAPARHAPSPPPTIQRSASREPQFKLVTKESMNTILSNRATEPTSSNQAESASLGNASRAATPSTTIS